MVEGFITNYKTKSIGICSYNSSEEFSLITNFNNKQLVKTTFLIIDF